MGWTIQGSLSGMSKSFPTPPPQNSKPAVGLTDPHSSQDRSRGLKRPGRESDHSTPSSEEMNEWNRTSIIRSMPSWHGQGQLYLVITVTSSGIIFVSK